MAFEVGRNVEAEAQSTDRRPRSGVVEEVLRGDPSPRYRIRWEDGHESIYTPASGALRARPSSKRSRPPASPKAPRPAASRKRSQPAASRKRSQPSPSRKRSTA